MIIDVKEEEAVAVVDLLVLAAWFVHSLLRSSISLVENDYDHARSSGGIISVSS